MEEHLFSVHWQRIDRWMQNRLDSLMKWHFWCGFVCGSAVAASGIIFWMRYVEGR